ncbi:MAG: hypothetical protein F4010_07565 [Cenarchaeum sp. SB0669_bin_11]|nr:hypothetical protein [Cenarchaeum sp. SB0669_bin_11]
MNTGNSRDTEKLLDEVFFKDDNTKSRLFGLEKTEVSIYKLLDHSYKRMSEFDAEFRFLRRVVYGLGTAIIGGLITIIFQLWRS